MQKKNQAFEGLKIKKKKLSVQDESSKKVKSAYKSFIFLTEMSHTRDCFCYPEPSCIQLTEGLSRRFVGDSVSN